MSIIVLNVDEVMRTLSNDGQYHFVVNDKTVDIVRFALNTGFTDVVLDEYSALRVMYQRPGESQVRVQTLTYYDTDGLHNHYDWHLLPSDLAEKGTLNCALCILRTDSEVEEWHTTPCQIRVLNTIHTDDSDEGDETITPTVAQRVAVLETMIQRVASGAPIVVASTSAMTDTAQIYVLSTDGMWYYHNGSAWVAGGTYGAVATDTTLTQPGVPADGKATGDALAETRDNLFNAPAVLDSDAEDIDIDITDEQGNVILRLADGHIMTKDFDSSNIPSATQMSIRESSAQGIDIDFCDLSGNVLLRLAGGGIQTADFNSAVDARHWAGKKWTAIGDSLTEVNQRTTKHYHDYIAEKTGINVVNLGHSGAGYYARPSDYCFRRRALQVETDSDVVTIFGSGNDVDKISLGNVTDTTADTLCGCINITIDNIFATAPLVPLGIITPTPWYQQSGAKNWTPTNPDNPMELYSNAIVEICKRRSIPCLDLYHCSNLHPDIASFRTAQFSKDDGNGIHPDETGHFLIAARFQAFLESLLLH